MSRMLKFFFYGPIMLLSLVAGCDSGGVRAFQALPGSERMRSTFPEGKPQLDFSPDEVRLGRVWWARNSARPPEDNYKGRIALSYCIIKGADGDWYWEPRTDASFAAIGAVNPISGSFSGWFKRSNEMDSGMPLLTGRYAMAGGPYRAGVTWALGVGGYEGLGVPLHRPSPVEEGRLFLYTPWVAAVADRPMPVTEWVHVAAVWDAEAGVRLYLNGEKVADTFSAGTQRSNPRKVLNLGDSVHPVVTSIPPVPLEQVHIHTQEGGGLKNFNFYDYPLTESGISKLYRGQFQEVDPLHDREEVPVDESLRRQWLGWQHGVDVSAAPRVNSGAGLIFREPEIAEARENHRAAGWLGVDGRNGSLFPWEYHGYSESGPKLLHVEYESAFRPDFLVMQGDLEGTLRLGNDSASDLATVELEPKENRLQKALSIGEMQLIDRFSVERKSGFLSELHLYQIDYTERDRTSPGSRNYFVSSQMSQDPISFNGIKYAEWLGSYKLSDRSFAELSSSPSLSAVSWVNLNGLQNYHLITPSMDSDFPLDAIKVKLPLRSLHGHTRVQLHVHDSFGIWRDWFRSDIIVEPDLNGEAVVEVTLDLRDQVILSGDSFWLTFTLENDAELRVGTDGGAAVELIEAEDAQAAMDSWKRWQMSTLRDEIEALSEPRPWFKVNDAPDSAWWLGVAYPQYRLIDRSSRELQERFPEDPVVRSWFQFTHPEMENPARGIKLPQLDEHPKWAVLAQENLKLYEEFVYYWTDIRADETGELGNWVGDDSDLLQDWLDFHFIADKDGRAGQLLSTFADNIWNRFNSRGSTPSISDGLNTRWTDDLHAYEDGVNIQSAAFWANYGDPLIYKRLMQTASRYDGFLFSRTEENLLKFAANGKGRVYWSATKPPEGDGARHPAYWNLILHPGLTALWYSGNPSLEEIYAAIGEEKLRSEPLDISSQVWPAAPVFYGLFNYFGGDAYLNRLLDLESMSQGNFEPRHWRSFEPMLLDRPELSEMSSQAIFQASYENPEQRYDSLETEVLGGMDRRFDRNWIEWKATGDIAYLEEGLEQLYRKLKYTMPSLTLAEQSGDRVAIPKSLISLTYLGGVATGRNGYFYPNIAVSYEGLDHDYAAVVLKSSQDELVIAFYNFKDEPVRGFLRPWRLAAGTYEVRSGARDFIENLPVFEELASSGNLEIKRGDPIPFTMPAQTTWVWTARITDPGRPLLPRADLAISEDAVEWVGLNTLSVDVFNIGSEVSLPTNLVVRNEAGKVLGAGLVPELAWPSALDVKANTMEIKLDPASLSELSVGDPLVVEVNPDRDFLEITELNNKIAVDLAGGVVE